MADTVNPCGCCEGTEALTPRSVANRPGLTALSYRCGTHSTFFETMRARLSNMALEVPGTEANEAGEPRSRQTDPRRYSLADLTTRSPDDPAIALLDAWATVADVLTFYQERIANEGYLRTAIEQRSVFELARLVGYRPRPGVAASVHLALELDADQEVTIQPHGLRAQSVPGPGELPQFFENIERIDTRHAWNRLRPRLTQPQTFRSITEGWNMSPAQPRLYVKGIGLNLKPNDVVLITVGGSADAEGVFHVAEVKPDPPNDRTLVTFQEAVAKVRGQSALEDTAREKARAFAMAIASEAKDSFALPPDADPLKNAMTGLAKPPSIPPRNAPNLRRHIRRSFDRRSDIGLQLAGTLDAGLRRVLPVALANVKVTLDTDVRAYVFRAVARPFGHNAQPRAVLIDGDNGKYKYTTYAEWEIDDPLGTCPPSQPGPTEVAGVAARLPLHNRTSLYLDAEYKIQSSGWLFIKNQKHLPLFVNIGTGQASASQVSITAYGISGKSTRLKLSEESAWLEVGDRSFAPVRETIVYCESEELQLAKEPIEEPVCDGADDPIELDGLHSGLQSGRWLIVSGERDDIKDEAGNSVRGVKAGELVMLGEVTQTVQQIWPGEGGGYSSYGPVGRPGDQTHSFITLAQKLQFCYRRDSVSIHANVVKATHGESRSETLGGGDSSRAFQSFTVKQPPLTFVASATPAGAESTLEVYVNDVRWHEADSLIELKPADRKFVTKTDDEGGTTIVFGNGKKYGALVPTGIENVRADYRRGIGRAGNVPAEQISQLVSKPLGVKGVINPLRASGGADRESRETARKNAPLTVTALDRLVSVSDYADFARSFAGIGKAVAASISDGRRDWVHVTVAGADDIPIDETSDLHRNLILALRKHGDPDQPVALQVRERILLVISANVRILPDYQWEPVVKAVRDRLYDTFSFERRELAQDVWLSQVIAAVQSVRGVAYVDVEVLGGIPEKKTVTGDQGRPIRRLLTPTEMASEAAAFIDQEAATDHPQSRVRANLAGFERGAMRPAQLVFLTPAVADTLVLNQIPRITGQLPRSGAGLGARAGWTHERRSTG